MKSYLEHQPVSDDMPSDKCLSKNVGALQVPESVFVLGLEHEPFGHGELY